MSAQGETALPDMLKTSHAHKLYLCGLALVTFSIRRKFRESRESSIRISSSSTDGVTRPYQGSWALVSVSPLRVGVDSGDNRAIAAAGSGVGRNWHSRLPDEWRPNNRFIVGDEPSSFCKTYTVTYARACKLIVYYNIHKNDRTGTHRMIFSQIVRSPLDLPRLSVSSPTYRT